jgi:hypothetical protein
MGRRHIHVYNEFDTCCFLVRDRDRLSAQEIKVKQKILGLGAGGAYELVIDGSGFGHRIHPNAMKLILDAL